MKQGDGAQRADTRSSMKRDRWSNDGRTQSSHNCKSWETIRLPKPSKKKARGAPRKRPRSQT
jgi:hypothetical protein